MKTLTLSKQKRLRLSTELLRSVGAGGAKVMESSGTEPCFVFRQGQLLEVASLLMRTKRNAKFPELWKVLENRANGGEGVVVKDGPDVVGLRAGAQSVSKRKKARIIDEPIVMQQRDINSNAAGVHREAARSDVDASELERVPLERVGFAWVGGQDTEAVIDEALACSAPRRCVRRHVVEMPERDT